MGGGGVGQVLYGWLIAHHAGGTVLTYSLADFKYAMWMFPITTVLALIAVLLTRETNCKR